METINCPFPIGNRVHKKVASIRRSGINGNNGSRRIENVEKGVESLLFVEVELMETRG